MGTISLLSVEAVPVWDSARRERKTMLNRKLILGALVILGAYGALPTLAVADPEIELHEHTSFTVSGGAATLASKGLEAKCTSVTGSGKFENSQAGTIELTYHECKAFGVSCTTSGQSAGTITTTELPFRVKSATGGKLAILISSKSEHVSTFKCSFLANVVVSGNGIVGMVTSPGFGEESSTMKLAFSGGSGVQGDTTVDGEETSYSLKASINGGASEPASLAGEAELSFAGKVQPPPVKALTIVVASPGDGTVKSTPIGIHCVIGCMSLFRQNTKIKLDIMELGFNFKEWKTKAGNPGTCLKAVKSCELTLSADANLEAIFE